MCGICGMPARALQRERKNIYSKSQSFFMQRLQRLPGNVSYTQQSNQQARIKRTTRAEICQALHYVAFTCLLALCFNFPARWSVDTEGSHNHILRVYARHSQQNSPYCVCVSRSEILHHVKRDPLSMMRPAEIPSISSFAWDLMHRTQSTAYC